ncbi:MAG: discoidin domain-containing protein [Marinifilaceae bacterium]
MRLKYNFCIEIILLLMLISCEREDVVIGNKQIVINLEKTSFSFNQNSNLLSIRQTSPVDRLLATISVEDQFVESKKIADKVKGDYYKIICKDGFINLWHDGFFEINDVKYTFDLNKNLKENYIGLAPLWGGWYQNWADGGVLYNDRDGGIIEYPKFDGKKSFGVFPNKNFDMKFYKEAKFYRIDDLSESLDNLKKVKNLGYSWVIVWGKFLWEDYYPNLNSDFYSKHEDEIKSLIDKCHKAGLKIMGYTYHTDAMSKYSIDKNIEVLSSINDKYNFDGYYFDGTAWGENHNCQLNDKWRYFVRKLRSTFSEKRLILHDSYIFDPITTSYFDGVVRGEHVREPFDNVKEMMVNEINKSNTIVWWIEESLDGPRMEIADKLIDLKANMYWHVNFYNQPLMLNYFYPKHMLKYFNINNEEKDQLKNIISNYVDSVNENIEIGKLNNFIPLKALTETHRHKQYAQFVDNPQKAIDGNLNTGYWLAKDNEDFIVDLGSIKSVSRLFYSNFAKDKYQKSFEIYCSNDNLNWNSIVVKNNLLSTFSDYIVVNKSFRYLKISNIIDNNNNNIPYLTEIACFK